MPTTTGKNDRYAEISAFGSSPDSPTAFSTTMIIGAIARIGMVWLATTHGISERSTARLWTISTARTMQRTVTKHGRATRREIGWPYEECTGVGVSENKKK